METCIPQIASLLRPVSGEVFSGKGKLCLSTSYLEKLNNAIDSNIMEDMNTSFHIVQTSNSKTNLIRDVQFLLGLVEKTVCLKINPDVVKDDCNAVDIKRFKNLKSLDIHKINIEIVIGIQKLRSQLQEITCCHSLNKICSILDKCGGDNSQRYNWSDLKKANFSYNNILEIDDSFECTISLQSLDLSHNNLKRVNFLNQLPNLKYLNLSYNKLDGVPNFKGQIRNRLQVMILNNNFIEDLSALVNLTNIIQLDLGQNCLLEHKCLLSISHLLSLQCLNLYGNPLSFHPHHRNLTSNYLNKNASTLKFLLDGIVLSNSEKGLVGSLYPSMQPQINMSSSNSLVSSTDSITEKPKRVRDVLIEEDNVKEIVSVPSPPMPAPQHLELKRQVEQLRKEYGESWLYRDSGLRVQDVLGFEKSSILSSTPFDSTLESLYTSNNESINYETAKESTSKTEFHTVNEESTIYCNIDQEDIESEASDGAEILTGGEECLFLVIDKENYNELFVVLTESHISERDVINSKEKGRWHVNTVISCTKMEDTNDVIKIEFDTLRRDRKQRVYQFENDERESFCTNLMKKLSGIKVEEQKVKYQCMKCSEAFSLKKNRAVLEEPSVICPNCSSNLVVENT